MIRRLPPDASGGNSGRKQSAPRVGRIVVRKSHETLTGPCEHGGVKVRLHNPRRDLEIEGPITIINLLARLDLNREAVLVVRDGELVPGDEALSDEDSIEIRPVISGGFL